MHKIVTRAAKRPELRKRRAAFRRKVAYHEAGHAVAAAVLKRRFEYVTIKPKGNVRAHMAYSLAKEHKRPTRRHVQAVVALAGPMAEGRYTRRNAVKLLRG